MPRAAKSLAVSIEKFERVLRLLWPGRHATTHQYMRASAQYHALRLLFSEIPAGERRARRCYDVIDKHRAIHRGAP